MSPDIAEDRTTGENDLLFLDVETTGLLFHRNSRIVEIGISLWNKKGHVKRLTSLINPQEPIPGLYTGIHGIDDAMVRNAPTFSEYWREYGEIFKNRTILAHNLSFDMGMLNRELLRIDKAPLGNAGIDTVPVLRKILPNRKSYKLQNLAGDLGIRQEASHRAGEDVRALEEILATGLGEPVVRLTEQMGINFSLWGGSASHRYFRDVIHWAQQKESPVLLVLAKRESRGDPNRSLLESTRLITPAYSGNHLGEFHDKGRYPIWWGDVYRIEAL